jgi:hypothetical protein
MKNNTLWFLGIGAAVLWLSRERQTGGAVGDIGIRKAPPRPRRSPRPAQVDPQGRRPPPRAPDLGQCVDCYTSGWGGVPVPRVRPVPLGARECAGCVLVPFLPTPFGATPPPPGSYAWSWPASLPLPSAAS